uniref:Uncharacterized protein n=1 Tax=Solanum lycopersicum TaxID=4081 RepID=A0A3Q7IPG3_SOLLC
MTSPRIIILSSPLTRLFVNFFFAYLDNLSLLFILPTKKYKLLQTTLIYYFSMHVL